MKISTKGRYALRVMLDIALNEKEEFISLNDIAVRQEISNKYLEKIIRQLNNAGYLKSSRGITGGYKLTKAPKEYKIGDILRTVEGDLAPVSCLSDKNITCSRKSKCMTLPFWKGLDHVIENYVDSKTLDDLINKEI